MLDPNKLEERLNFKFTFELTADQRALLVASTRQQYFDLLQRIMEEELKEFHTQLMNTPIAKPEEVLANHIAARTVTQWYVGFMRKIAEQIGIQNYTETGLGTKSNPEQAHLEPDFTN
jgi:hypothetical protein